MFRPDIPDSGFEQAREQLPDHGEPSSARARRLVESQHRVPALVECQIATGDEYPKPLFAFVDPVRIGGCLVAQHPHLGMDDSSTRGPYRHHSPFDKGERPAGRWQEDLPRLAEDRQLVSMSVKRVNQFHGLVTTGVSRGISQACNGECGRRRQERLQVEGEGHRHGRFQSESRRRAQGVDERQSVGRYEHQRSACNAVAISAR